MTATAPRPTPPPPAPAAPPAIGPDRRSPWIPWLRLAAVLVLVGGLAFWFVWHAFFRVEPQQRFTDRDARVRELMGGGLPRERADGAFEAEWFKYGSLGGESEAGIPYFVWLVLPRIFRDEVPGPGGYASFGFAWEEGEELPVGFAKRTVGFPRVTNNCALCHTATYRKDARSPRVVVPGGPSHRADVQGYIRFLTAVADDPRFNAATILDEVSRAYDARWHEHGGDGLSRLDKALYRYVIIPALRTKLLEQAESLRWMADGRPHWGPGRDDAMSLVKFALVGMPADASVGTSDFPSVWNLAARRGHRLNWDGANPAAHSVVVDSAVGLGARPGGEFNANVARVESFLDALPAPPYPFAIDRALADRGAGLYAEHCADCHAGTGRRTGQVIPVEEVGTDRARLDALGPQAVAAINAKVKALGVTRPDMIKTNGYASPLLDGIWLRAPYLHNGSVPTLDDLLKPGAERPRSFVRGSDVYDPAKVGFVSGGDAASKNGREFDAALPGNGNQGHEYGTRLPPDQRAALLEFLKTL